jgi:hypothetical protein
MLGGAVALLLVLAVGLAVLFYQAQSTARDLALAATATAETDATANAPSVAAAATARAGATPTPQPAAATATAIINATLIARPSSKVVEVRADKDWQDTGMYVQADEPVSICYLSGKWSPCAPYGCPFVGIGANWEITQDNLKQSRNDSDNVVSNCYHGGLIARMSSHTFEPFCVSIESMCKQWTARESGNLELRINDWAMDNTGTILVDIAMRK